MSEDTPPPVSPPAPNGSEPRPRRRRDRRLTMFGAGGWGRRLARLWGFLGFVILVVILARSVILPFIFALVIAYVLAPIIDWMTLRRDGTRRMPRPLAILICYVMLLAFLASFFVVLLPRLSKDATRIRREAPALYDRVNDEWVPQLANWLETSLFSMRAPAHSEPDVIGDEPVPPGTAFVITPLLDGRMAVQIPPGGMEFTPRTDGGYNLSVPEESADAEGVEDKLRVWAGQALASLQGQIGDFFRFGRAVITGLIRSVFTFFLVLMVAAFILIDLEKLHGFFRGLIPEGYRDDYDVIVVGMNRGLSGVIRGQLLICVVNGILTYIGLVLFGIKYSLILAVIAAIMSLIPIFGSILSTLPIVLAALVSGDEGIEISKAIFSVAWIVGIHFVEANFLNPKIIGTAARIHPVLVIFALILGEHSYGLVGALLAVPVLSMIQVLFLYFRKKAWRTEDPPRRVQAQRVASGAAGGEAEPRGGPALDGEQASAPVAAPDEVD